MFTNNIKQEGNADGFYEQNDTQDDDA